MSQPSSEPELTDPEFLAPVETTDSPASEPAQVAPQYRQQGFSIYSVMLILSFVFLLTAMIFFLVEAGRYQ